VVRKAVHFDGEQWAVAHPVVDDEVHHKGTQRLSGSVLGLRVLSSSRKVYADVP
jgi:hypothetical protein